MILLLLILSTGYTKPPKPGPNFIWVKPYTLPDGISIPGHWKYTGPPKKGKTRMLGHYKSKGEMDARPLAIVSIHLVKLNESFEKRIYKELNEWQRVKGKSLLMSNTVKAVNIV
jgi:hypothetical protein